MGETIDRRTFLAGAATAGGLAAALAACGGGSSPASTSSTTTISAGTTMPGSTSGAASSGGLSSILPAYKQFSGVTPDLPGDLAGVPDGFVTYPHPAKPSTDGKPGRGGTITAMIPISVQAPTPLTQNKWWQGLNNALGVDLKVEMTPGANYLDKVQTTLAGGNLPDLVQLSTAVPRLPEVFTAKFQDLTDYLSGDAALEYPNLANLRTLGWTTCVADRRIYAIPPQNIVGTPTWIRRDDIIEKRGVTFNPKNADEIKSLCQEITDRNANIYAFGNGTQVVEQIGCVMYNAPNNWAVKDGAFTSMYETGEYQQALQYAADLWKLGVIHPDAYGNINAPALYQSGQVLLFPWGGIGYGLVLAQNIPGLKMGFWAVPSADGKTLGAKRLGTGTNGLCAMAKQSSEDRIKEILRIWNWLCAPFGTSEFLQMRFGDEGVDWTWDDKADVPVATDRLKSDNPGSEFVYMGGPAFVLFDPGYEYATRAMYQVQRDTIPLGVHDASAGLYSTTNDSQGAVLVKPVTDARDQVVQGRRSMSDFESAVKRWRSSGGDKIRAELEAAYARLH